jgi:hypothetical protein
MHWRTIRELKKKATTNSSEYYDGRGNIYTSHLNYDEFVNSIINKCIDELALDLFNDTDDNLERWQEDRNDGIKHCIRKLEELRDEQ